MTQTIFEKYNIPREIIEPSYEKKGILTKDDIDSFKYFFISISRHVFLVFLILLYLLMAGCLFCFLSI
jgi:hypothetical protein